MVKQIKHEIVGFVFGDNEAKSEKERLDNEEDCNQVENKECEDNSQGVFIIDMPEDCLEEAERKRKRKEQLLEMFKHIFE